MRIPRTLVLSAGLGLAAVAVALPTATAAPSPTTGPGGPTTATSGTVAAAVVASATATRPRHRRTKAIMPTRRTKLAAGSATAPMAYHGGRLMTAPANVYLVWYGDWSAKPAVPVPATVEMTPPGVTMRMRQFPVSAI